MIVINSTARVHPERQFRHGYKTEIVNSGCVSARRIEIQCVCYRLDPPHSMRGLVCHYKGWVSISSIPLRITNYGEREGGKEGTKINGGYHWSYRLSKDDALTEFSNLNFIRVPQEVTKTCVHQKLIGKMWCWTLFCVFIWLNRETF